jgi:hypothetical protein
MGTQIDFVGYSEDCTVEGRVELERPRLADMLNDQPTIVVHDAVLVSTADGHSTTFDELEVSRDELGVVVVSGPRGDPGRRLATRPNEVTMKVGPYVAAGYMHAPATTNPVSGLNRRPVMLAMTDAVLEYEYCDEPVSQAYTTILINRELAMYLRAVTNPGETPTDSE